MKITIPMYEKGRSFIMAAALVKAYGGDRFVYYHLLCQDFENIGKAILLNYDYEKYGPQLIKVFHHNLEKIYEELCIINEKEFLSKKAKNQLIALNKFYKKQKLRYGHKVDFKNTSNLKSKELYGEILYHLDDLNEMFTRK